MKIHRSITEPIRDGGTWQERWNSEDNGLIACWERGREKRLEDPALAVQAVAGQLVVLPWKGGVEKSIKKKQKFGTAIHNVSAVCSNKFFSLILQPVPSGIL